MPEHVLTTILDPRYKLVPFHANFTTSAVQQGLTPLKSASALAAKNMLLKYMHKSSVRHDISYLRL